MTATIDSVAVLREGDRRDWRRHPVDVARLVVRLGLLLFVLGLTAAFPAALTNVSVDVVQLFNRLPSPIRYACVVAAQLSMIVIPIVIVTWLLVRRTRAATLLVVGTSVVSGVVMLLLTDWLNRAAPPATITDLASNSFVATDFPSSAYLAALVAGATVASPLMTITWRRIAWTAVTLAAIVRVLSATQAPVGIAVTLALGSTLGSAALVIFGSPQRRPGSATLRAALAGGGFEVDHLGDEESRLGVRTYHGTAAGEPVDVVYLDRDDRDAELLARVVRSIRVRDVEEHRLSLKPRFRAAQVALATSMAERTGARVPPILAVVPAPRDSAVYASSSPAGRALSDLDADQVTDTGLDDLWRQLMFLHGGRIAHRSLTADNLYFDGDNVTLLGLDAALLASSAESRAIDLAELIVTTSVTVGVDRALDAAVRSVPSEQLERALPFMQVPALPVHAQKLVKKEKKLVAELRTGLQERLGVDEVVLAEIERVSFGKIVTWVGFAVLAYFLLTLITDWSEISEAMSGINWVWAIPVVIATLMGTVGGAMSLSGSVIRPIALGEAIVIMFGQSFLNRFTPMNAGGMAMRIRYLQKGGTDVTVATAAIGLTSAASGAMQVLFIVFFFLWSSSDPSSGFGSTGGALDVSLVAFVALVVVVAALVVAFTPKFRRWLVAFVKDTIAKIRSDFGELARRPSKLGLLFGGAAIAKMATIVAFAASCRAFDIGLSFATIGALYLAANTVASTIPTPGGVGAIEAALVFVLTNAGVEEATAWAAVLLFRLINYWFPTIPGYIALRISERRGLV